VIHSAVKVTGAEKSSTRLRLYTADPEELRFSGQIKTRVVI
jgi:hypothetical protein